MPLLRTGLCFRVPWPPPDANVILAKIFGLKTGIVGFDDLLGGGLIVDARQRSSQELDELPSPSRAVHGVIHGLYASGKSIFAAQLAFEMARKGGAGILLVLEQSVPDVVAQYHHFGWLPDDDQFEVIHRGNGPGGEEEELERFQKALTSNQGMNDRGVLWIRALEDASLGQFQHWLEDTADMDGFAFDARQTLIKGPRFIIIDPLDAVEWKIGETEAQVRNRMQQLMESVTGKGLCVWTINSDVEPGRTPPTYSIVPQLGDVVIRLVSRNPDQIPRGFGLADMAFKYLSFEKVRAQLVATGFHPFEIQSQSGVCVYPSGDALSRFSNWQHADLSTSSKPLSLGHPALDIVLGDEGVPPASITTIMGPAGCNKTGLALLFLLSKKPTPTDRVLFITFKDTRDSIGQTVRGPMLGLLGLSDTNFQRENEHFDFLPLKTHLRTSAWVLWKIRERFKALGPGRRYSRVVVDNVAYMELTSPLIKEDPLFVSNLVELIRREGAAGMFITSKIDGAEQESHLQMQIRDASDTVLALDRESLPGRDPISLRVAKSALMRHASHRIEVLPFTRPDKAPSARKIIPRIKLFLRDSFWFLGCCHNAIPSATDPAFSNELSTHIDNLAKTVALDSQMTAPKGLYLAQVIRELKRLDMVPQGHAYPVATGGPCDYL